MLKSSRIVITGAAGLVGQNLVIELIDQGYTQLVAIDKHARNLRILEQLHPEVEVVCADLAEPGEWANLLTAAICVVQLHAQITGKTSASFERNNVIASRHLINAMKNHAVPYLLHISSSVVNSAADDDYTRTKKAQEQLVLGSGIRHCILRPTLMFGWFDPKHLGWLARFMSRTPIFPIPGHGRYMRQPLYERDFCRCLTWCIANRPVDKVYNLVGDTRVDYIDIILTIKRALGLRTAIVHIPAGLFSWLLRMYALLSSKPPFTTDQLAALTAGDDFDGVDTEAIFGVSQTPFESAIRETFCDPRYSAIVLQR